MSVMVLVAEVYKDISQGLWTEICGTKNLADQQCFSEYPTEDSKWNAF